MDEAGWFSVTPEVLAAHHARQCNALLQQIPEHLSDLPPVHMPQARGNTASALLHGAAYHRHPPLSSSIMTDASGGASPPHAQHSKIQSQDPPHDSMSAFQATAPSSTQCQQSSSAQQLCATASGSLQDSRQGQHVTATTGSRTTGYEAPTALEQPSSCYLQQHDSTADHPLMASQSLATAEVPGQVQTGSMQSADPAQGRQACIGTQDHAHGIPYTSEAGLSPSDPLQQPLEDLLPCAEAGAGLPEPDSRQADERQCSIGMPEAVETCRGVFVDGFAGVGGNAIQAALAGFQVMHHLDARSLLIL